MYDNDFGGCSLYYQLLPVCCLPNLMSFYGAESQHRACPHGWTHFKGRNFWQNGSSIYEITLKDLFWDGLDWSSVLLEYCDTYFRTTKYGYYADNDFTPELLPSDLDIFVVTEKGLVIIFSSYRVNGWADGPDMVLIPYNVIMKYIDPRGPLKEVPAVLGILEKANL